MKAEAPGKLILSGEHSVVYGAPALAIAVGDKVSASFKANLGDHILIRSGELLGQTSLDELSLYTERLNQRYEDFLTNRCSISDILACPTDLLFYVLAHTGFHKGGELDITSNIPTGAGMGSSAAVIGALVGLAKHAGFVSPDMNTFETIRYCERLQHGRGSAIDAAAVTYGGCVRVQEGTVTSLDLSIDQHWYVWNSGKPQSSTGETVAAVREKFQHSNIWQDFAQVTLAFEHSLAANQTCEIVNQIQQNQALLEQINIVPDAVKSVIRKVEQLGGAAKICGAGTLSGDEGGMVLLYHPELNQIQLQQALNIKLESITQSDKGVHIAAN